MGIKDIPLSTTPPVQGIPVPPELETIIQTPKGQISNDPQSGSILKLLGENGFKEKIQEGYKNGKTYSILHAAPSPDFTLIESWTETTKDDQGNTITNPRKNYQFFKIVVDTPAPSIETTSAPIQEAITEPASHPEPGPTNEPTPSVNNEPVEQKPEATIPVQIPVITAPEQPPVDRAREVADKIKRGGAGMTQEDWQYRNENWPAIEKYLMPAQNTVNKPDTPKVTTSEPKTKESAADTPVVTAPIGVAATQSTTTAVPQHYDSKAWLMQKLGSPKVTPKTSPAQTQSSTVSSTTNSYDLLKARFAKTAVAPAPETISAPTPENPNQRREAFIQSFFATAPQEWEIAKTIPARAFIYPTEYAWGNDDQGNQLLKTLEDFPINSKKLRERVAQSIEDLATQGINIDTISLDQAIIDLFDKGIL